MIPIWYMLILGSMLGLVPPRLLLQPDCRYLSFEDLWSRVLRRDDTLKSRRIRWWRLPLLWIDPLRGYMVAWFLLDGLRPVPKASPGLVYAEIGLTALMLLSVLKVQTGHRSKERESIAPVLFLGGMLVALLPWTVWAPAFVLGVATAIAMNGFIAGFLFAALAVIGAGYIYMSSFFTLATALLLLVAPILLNWVRDTRFVAPVRY